MNRYVAIQLSVIFLVLHIPLFAADNIDPMPVPPGSPTQNETTILYKFYADYSVKPNGDTLPLIYRPVGFRGISPTNKNESTFVYGSNFTVTISHCPSSTPTLSEPGSLSPPSIVEPQPRDQLFHIKKSDKNCFVTITPSHVIGSNEITVLDGLDIEGFVADISDLHSFSNTSQHDVAITEMDKIYDVQISLGSQEFPYTIHSQYNKNDGFLDSMEFFAKWQNDDSWDSLNYTISLFQDLTSKHPSFTFGVPLHFTSVITSLLSVAVLTKLIRRTHLK